MQLRGNGPVLSSGSKGEQNKHSLLASAYKYRVNLPCSNRLAASQAISHLLHLGRDHILNDYIYKTPGRREVSGHKEGSLCPRPHQQCHQWERWEPLGIGQADREDGNTCCKWRVKEEGTALRKEEERMKERRNHQLVPEHVTQTGPETENALLKCGWLLGVRLLMSSHSMRDGSFASPCMDAWAALASASQRTRQS